VSAPDVSLDLLRRYNVPGPRYTSYPTAPVWKEGFGPADYEGILAESAAAPDPAPLSLYFHLPFCERLCYFCGCTVVITGTRHTPENPYLDALEREIDWVAARRAAGPCSSWGGGTPDVFPAGC
jgi:oxygen-independent coproporphyrinogen-3 oxidase